MAKTYLLVREVWDCSPGGDNSVKRTEVVRASIEWIDEPQRVGSYSAAGEWRIVSPEAA
jgi:hypothetical protein